MLARFERGHSIAATVLHPASHSSCSPSCIPYSFGREREREQWRKFHSITRGGGGADSDQCRPRGWHHQLQIAPPPLTPRTLALQPVIAPTRAANNHGGRRDSGKGAQLVPFPFFSLNLIMRLRTDLISIIGRGALFPQFLYAPKLFSAARQFSYHHSSIVVTAHTRPVFWNRGCVTPSMPP